uniref:Uncharacterized protein n=1 Tax=Glossina pallidipes TaxID=7398 RepID=A0A1B0A4J2_GLOPL
MPSSMTPSTTTATTTASSSTTTTTRTLLNSSNLNYLYNFEATNTEDIPADVREITTIAKARSEEEVQNRVVMSPPSSAVFQ